METKKEKIIHIPEKGCHNCRLHCINHKECDSEFPCKQGMEWRPILPESDKPEGKSAEEFLNSKALEDGYNDEDGNHFHYWNDCSQFDLQEKKLILWLEEYASQSKGEDVMVSDEDIKEIAHKVWTGTANTFRLYPNNKHTFAGFWDINKEVIINFVRSQPNSLPSKSERDGLEKNGYDFETGN